MGVGFEIADGRKVVPDILLSSLGRSATLLLEVKSGSSIEHGQAGRLEAVAIEDLRDRAYLPIADADSHRIGILYVCAEDGAEAIGEALSDRAFTIVSFDGSRFDVRGADLPDADLQQALRSARVEPGASPLQIVPFDGESRLAAVAYHVLPAVVSLLVRGDLSFGIDEVLQETHGMCLEAMKSTGSGAELRDLRRQILEVMKLAAAQEFSDLLTRSRSNQPQWEFAESLPRDQASKTRTLQSLQKRAADLVARLDGGASLELDLFAGSE